MIIMQTLAHTKFVNLVKDSESNWVWAQRRSEDIAGGVQVAAIVDTNDLHRTASVPQTVLDLDKVSQEPIKLSGKSILFLLTKRKSLEVDHGAQFSIELAAGAMEQGESKEHAAGREALEELGREIKKVNLVGWNHASSAGITSEIQHFTIAELGGLLPNADEVIDKRERNEVFEKILAVPVEQAMQWLDKQQALENPKIYVSALTRAGLSFVLEKLKQEQQQSLVGQLAELKDDLREEYDSQTIMGKISGMIQGISSWFKPEGELQVQVVR
ncbi:MAG: NUDIX domain-containing protein [Cyanobacteria bacterium]|nr:NUDIX domain-containing protein [Cyanobacteriota bacterium]